MVLSHFMQCTTFVKKVIKLSKHLHIETGLRLQYDSIYFLTFLDFYCRRARRNFVKMKSFRTLLDN